MLSRPKEWKRSICAFACPCFITHVYVNSSIVAMARCISDVGYSVVLNVSATCINEPIGGFRHEQPLSAMGSSDAVVSGWFGWRNCKVVIFAGSVQCCNKLDPRRKEGLKGNMVYCSTWKRNSKCEEVTSYLLLARTWIARSIFGYAKVQFPCKILLFTLFDRIEKCVFTTL